MRDGKSRWRTALLLAHGLCALMGLAFSVLGVLSEWRWYGRRWWEPPVRPVEDIIGDGMSFWNYREQLYFLTWRLLGLALALAFVAFVVLLRRRRRAGLALFCAVVGLELCVVVTAVHYADFARLLIWYYAPDRIYVQMGLLALMLPFVAAILLSCFGFKTLKQYFILKGYTP